MNGAGNICTTLPLIGGGTNGTGFARDAAGRGLKAQLRDEDDFGRHTSSASARLIHGGLRYLEKFDFKLVGHSLREREIVLRNSPRIIWQRTRQGIRMNAHQADKPVFRIDLSFAVKRACEMIAAIGVATLKAVENFKITIRIQGRLFRQEMQITAWDH